MLIAGVSLLVLLATAIFLWRPQRDETISGNFQSSLAPQPSVTEQPVSETPTPTPAEAKKPPVEIELIFVPAGSFKMGADDGFDNEQPVHEVTFSEGFYMGKYEVTQAQWQAVVGDNPSHFQNCDNCPVENVSWVDVHRFLEKLNDGNETWTYRLPSEAEWEYACRAGTTGTYAGPLNELAWYNDNSEAKTHPVGRKKPNAFGLYDMHGNVWEFCEDVHYANYEGAPSDGSARVKEGGPFERMARGGAWEDPPSSLKSSYRGWNPPTKREAIVGFRVVAFRIN
jgi:formylglycine-generating enzyme required for sulfatase activity